MGDRTLNDETAADEATAGREGGEAIAAPGDGATASARTQAVREGDAIGLSGDGAASAAIPGDRDGSDAGAGVGEASVRAPLRERAKDWLRAHEWTLDAALLFAITAGAALLRLVRLGNIPYGVHSDEAQVGTDAHRILSEGWIGVYTHAALGQPAGHAYLTTPSIWLLGDNAFALRLPLALVALAAVPLLYLLVRVSFGRIEAAFSSAMLAVSYWHLFYSRVAHWSISYGTVVLAVLLCIMLGLRTGRWGWYAGAGALLGLGVYTYNVYPIAAIAVGAFLAIMTVRVVLADRRRRLGDAGGSPADDDADARIPVPALKPWLVSMGVLAVAMLIVAGPMINYVRNPDAYYWFHFNNYEDVRITRTPEYAAAGAWERIGLILGQAKYFASAYAWHGRHDIVDGNGLRPVFDPLTLVLLAAGVVLAWRYRRQPMVIAALCCFAIIPLPAVLQKGSIMREPVGAAPYAMFFAALPLAALWRGAMQREQVARWLPAGAALLAVAAIGAITFHDYFGTLPGADLTRFVYFSQETSASTFMRRLPAGSYVYFYSDRAPFRLETRQFLAPDVAGEDRSAEFAGVTSIPEIDPAQRSVFILMDRYEPMIASIEARYPGGQETVVTRDGKFEFIAYEIAPQESARAAP